MLGDDEEQTGRNMPDRAPAGPARGGAVVVHDRGRGYGAYEWYGDDAQEESGIDLQKYIRILLKHWPWVLAAIAACIALGVANTLLTTPMYRSAATIQIDREPVQVGSLQSTEQRDLSSADEFFQTQHNLLKSRALAERTVDNYDLASNDALLASINVGQPGEDGQRPSLDQIRRQLAGFIQSRLQVQAVGRSRIVQISMETPDRNASAQLVNAVSESFVTWNLDRRLDDSTYAREFLQEKLAEEKAKLEDYERELANYATEQRLISITTSSTDGGASADQTLVGSSLLSINDQLNQAQAERIRAEQRYNQALAAGENATEVIQNPTVQSLKQQIAQLQAEYRDRLAIFTPNEENTRALNERIVELQSTLDREVQGVIQSLQAEYEAARGQEEQLASRVSGLTNDYFDQNSRSIEYDILKREVDTTRQQYDSLLAEFNGVSVVGGISSNNISVIDQARPGGKSRPQPVKNIMTAALIGLFLGIGLAFLLEYLDESIKSPDDVEKKLGLSLLGTVPKLERGIKPIDALQDIRSAFSEAYYSVRTALQFSTDEGVPSSLLVTSARPSEGKSTSALAVAQNFARLGLRVLLIDGDLRNPSLHRTLSIENSAGLSNFLTGGMPLSRLVQTTESSNLSFIPCGPLPPNPAELLAGSRVDHLLKEAREHFDVVVIDGPPVMGLADAPILASAVSGTMLVIEAGQTGRNLAKVALRRLNVGAPRILGVLLTKFDAKKSSYGYGYGYGYAYDYDYGSRPQLKSGNN